MNHLPKLLAAGILLVLYGFAVPSSLSEQEISQLSGEFAFLKQTIPAPANLQPKYVRDVHPQYAKLSTWISSIGAAVAFLDYDGDGLNNDVAHIDPRFDRVVVMPAPNTGNRFVPIELAVQSLPFNRATMVPSGTLANDFNEDGKVDVLVHYLGRSPIIFYQTETGFAEAELCDRAVSYNSSTGTIADLNGDGHADIFVGNYFPDITKLYDKTATDRDQVMQHSMSRGDNGAPNRIFLWTGVQNGKAQFVEDKHWLDNLHYPNDWTLAVAAADLNNDMMPELYIANDFGPDKLLLNTSKPGSFALSFQEVKGEKCFTTLRSNVLGKDSFKGMGVDIADMNRDGLLDIFVSNIAADYALHESHFAFINTGNVAALNKGIAPFENQSEALGLSRSSWGWDSKVVDFNNDGTPEAIQATGFVKGTINRWPELQEVATANDEVLSNPAVWPKLTPGADISGDAHVPFFVKSKSGRYYDLSMNLGLADNQITRGIAISDVDHDGKLDFMTANQWEDSRFYHNKSQSTNGFIGLSVQYALAPLAAGKPQIDTRVAGRSATGAVVKVRIPGQSTPLVGYVDGGNGHTGKNSNEVHFGLGRVSANQPLDVEVIWHDKQARVQKTTARLTPGWHRVSLPY